jgi:hypothetical protein
MKRFLTRILYFALIPVFAYIAPSAGGGSGQIDLPAGLQQYIRLIRYSGLADLAPRVTILTLNDHLTKVTLSYDLKRNIPQNDWRVEIVPAFQPSFHWAPLLTPKPENIIAQHVFRSPALIVADSSLQLSVIPDLDLVGKKLSTPWYMDMDALSNTLTLGLSHSALSRHVQYVRKGGMIIPSGKMQFAFYIISEKVSSSGTPWRSTEAFL